MANDKFSIHNMTGSNLVTGKVIGNVTSQGGMTPEGTITAEKVAELLTSLEQKIQDLEGLPPSEKEKSIQRLGAAKAEAEEGEPDKKSIANQLKRVNETLIKAGETSRGIRKFTKETAPTFAKIAGWLGYAVGSIWRVM